ncbi:hypothetical protein LTR53_005396 [Teratosphaeriaceae sp. CCFEE 6253]|nr:hypothetical protein LTR53_005396 [Teratosphaeriaceae sp. CCFEE 6253]
MAGNHNAFESLLRAIDEGASRRSGSASATMSGHARSTGSGTARREVSPPPPMPSISRLPMVGSQSRKRSKAASTTGSKISKGHGKQPSMAGSQSRSQSRATSTTGVPRVSGISKEQGKQPSTAGSESRSRSKAASTIGVPQVYEIGQGNGKQSSMAGSQSRSRSKAASTAGVPQVSKESKGKGQQPFKPPSTRARTRSHSRAPSTKTWAPTPSTIRTLPTIPPRSHAGSGSVSGTLAPWDTLTHRGVGAEEWWAEAEVLRDVRRSYTEGDSKSKGAGKGRATAATSRAPTRTRSTATATASGVVNSRFGMPRFGSGGSKVGVASRTGGGVTSRVSGSRGSIATDKLPDIDDLASEAQAAVRREADDRQERLGGQIERMMGR